MGHNGNDDTPDERKKGWKIWKHRVASAAIRAIRMVASTALFRKKSPYI